jgi:hypothetical protein
LAEPGFQPGTPTRCLPTLPSAIPNLHFHGRADADREEGAEATSRGVLLRSFGYERVRTSVTDRHVNCRLGGA